MGIFAGLMGTLLKKDVDKEKDLAGEQVPLAQFDS